MEINFCLFCVVFFINIVSAQTSIKGNFNPSSETSTSCYFSLFKEITTPQDSLLYKFEIFDDSTSQIENKLTEIDTVFYSYIRPNPFFRPYAWLKINCDSGSLAIVCYAHEKEYGELYYIDFISYNEEGHIIGVETFPYRKMGFGLRNYVCVVDGILFLNHNRIKYYIINDNEYLMRDKQVECQEFDFEIMGNGKLKKIHSSKYFKKKVIRSKIGNVPKQLPIDFQIQ